MNKSGILLELYDVLREGGGIRINECCGKYCISVATFRRYIAFLRGYFNEHYGSDVIYCGASEEYRIGPCP